jgi:hypothetical protein
MHNGLMHRHKQWFIKAWRAMCLKSPHRTGTNMPQPFIPPKTLTRVPDFSPGPRLIFTVHHTTFLKIENTTEANEEAAQ